MLQQQRHQQHRHAVLLLQEGSVGLINYGQRVAPTARHLTDANAQ